MHFFTEPTLLNAQVLADAFGPTVGDETNKFEISSKHTVSAKAKIIACQEAMMLVLPHVDSGGAVSPTLVNLVLKPITGLDIQFSPVKYYIYRGVDKASFLSGAAIIPDSDPDKTEFIAKFWTNWNNFKTNTNQLMLPDPTPQSFGYDPTLTDPAKKVLFLEEFYNSEDSTNTVIQDFQAIKVEEGEWIAHLSAGVNFEFEIVMDTDHLRMDLEYAELEKQIIDITGKVGFDRLAEQEKILNFIDPAAFFGMHFYPGVNLVSFTGATKNPPDLKIERDLYNDVITKFHNKNVVYLDVRSEHGYSYNLYENYRNDQPPGPPVDSPMINLKSSSAAAFESINYIAIKWPLFNLTLSPPAALSSLTDGDNIDLQLRINDNTKPLLFAENPKLFGAANTNNFKIETDLIDPADLPLTAPGDWTNTITLEIPFVDNGGVESNVAHHIKLHYFRQEDNSSSPSAVFKLGRVLDGAYGGISIPELDIPTPFQHVSNSKYKFVKGSNFSYVAKTGVYRDNTLVLLYADNAFSLQQSGNTYPTIDARFFSNQSILDNPLLQNDKIYKKWQITEGASTIDLLEIVGYNPATPAVAQEDILFLGLVKTELDALNALGGLFDGHHKYLKFEEVLQVDGSSLQDAATGTPYKKFEVKVQGLDASKEVQTVAPAAGSEIYVYGSNLNLLSSAAFAAASALPNLLPDPGTFTEYDYFHRHDYAENDSVVDLLFPTGTVRVEDNGNNIRSAAGGRIASIATPKAGLIGELFYPVDSQGSTTLSSRQTEYPLVLICNANGGRYSDYRSLAGHLALNGFITASISGLLYNDLNVFAVFEGASLPGTSIHYNISISPAFSSSSYYVINQFYALDALYIYDNDMSNTATHEKLTVLRGVWNYTVGPPITFTVISQDTMSWQKGIDFEIYVKPETIIWEKQGAAPAADMSKFGLAWTSNSVVGAAKKANLTKVGSRLVELTAADWALDNFADIKSTIDSEADLASFDVDYPSGALGKYLGTIMDGVYYMFKLNSSSETACAAGLCVTIEVEVKNRQIVFDLDVGQHGMGILGRANLVYPHLQIINKYIDDNFAGGSSRIENNVGLIGHSRGAEAVVRCATDYAGIPNFDLSAFAPPADPRAAPKWKNIPNGLTDLNAVISLAPTDQSRVVPPKVGESIAVDIPYFVLYGAMEGDVIGEPTGSTPNRTCGFSIYDRSDNATEKSMAFVYGATHNGFITNNQDFIGRTRRAPKWTGTMINTVIQKRITLGYMNAFLRMHLRGENIWKPYFFGDLIPLSSSYDKIYLQYKNMASPASKWINNFDGAAGTLTLKVGAAAAAAPAAGSDLEHGALIDMDERTPHDTEGIQVKWASGTESILLIEVDGAGKDISSFEFLSFRIGMAYEMALTYADLSTVELELQYLGMPAGVFSTTIGREIPEPDLRIVPTLSGVDAALTKTAMMTVRFPLSEFLANGVDLTKITHIQLTFPAALTADGKVLIDDIEFTD